MPLHFPGVWTVSVRLFHVQRTRSPVLVIEGTRVGRFLRRAISPCLHWGGGLVQ